MALLLLEIGVGAERKSVQQKTAASKIPPQMSKTSLPDTRHVGPAWLLPR